MRDLVASYLALTVVSSAANGAIFGGDMYVDGFIFLTDEGMLDSGVFFEEGLGCCG